MCGLIAAAVVLDDGSPAFSSAEQVARLLSEREASRLFTATFAVLNRISPIYGRSDTGAWHARLLQGAKDSRNIHLAARLGRCIDISFGASVGEIMHRPERYFGGVQADLTDGQWLVFRAARALVQEMK